MIKRIATATLNLDDLKFRTQILSRRRLHDQWYKDKYQIWIDPIPNFLVLFIAGSEGKNLHLLQLERIPKRMIKFWLLI